MSRKDVSALCIEINRQERLIGPDQPVFVIAEAGINHNGSVERAKALIDAAQQAGADAVKFQKRNLAETYQQKLLQNPNQAEQKYQYLIPLLQEFTLPDEAYVELERYATEQGILFLVNPWDSTSADDIERLLNIPLYKIGSPDLTNDELLSYIAQFKKPMILSTGMSVAEEIVHAVQLLESHKVDFALLHCNNTYPAPFDEINLRYMDELAKQYPVPIGYSGHERGIAVSIAAVARGACIIERHLTTDKSLPGPDHKASLDPIEFKAMVAGIRQVEPALGQAVKRLSRAEVMNRELLAKSIVAKQYIADGTVITREMLTTKSPAKGLSPQRMDEVVGITAQRTIMAGEPVTEDDLVQDEAWQSGSVVAVGGDGDTAGSGGSGIFDGKKVPWKWGPVVRWHDFEQYLPYQPQVFEFHLSDKDLDEPLPTGQFEQAVVVHAPEYMKRVYLNPAATDAAELKVARETLQRTVDVARQLGEQFRGTLGKGGVTQDAQKPKVVIHPGGITLQPYVDRQQLLDIFAETLHGLKADGVDLLPENLPPRPWVFGGEWVTNIFMVAEEIQPFLDELGLSMCFDTSHAVLACNAQGVDLVEQIKTLRPYIKHLHVADGAGIGEEGLQIGEGGIQWEETMKVLAGYDETMVPEIWQGHLRGGRGFWQAMMALQEVMT